MITLALASAGGKDLGVGGPVFGVCLSIFHSVWQELLAAELFDLKNEVNTIEDGAREVFLVIQNLSWQTGADVVGVTEIATGAGIHSADEHETGGIGGVLVGASDGDSTVLKGLTKGFEDGSGVFGHFVEEEDAAVGERDFSRESVGAATDDGSSAGGMMWGAKGSCDTGVATGMDEIVELGDFNLFVW